MPTREFTKLQRAAAAHGGRLLSRTFVGTTAKLRFRCSRGHEWAQSAIRLLSHGKWCPDCARANKNVAAKLRTFARLREYVRRRGGAVLSPAYVNGRTPLRYRCAEGHVWSRGPTYLLQGHWCPVCTPTGAGARKLSWKQLTQRRLLAIVKRRGGELLTPLSEWTSKIRIRCEHGHEWEERHARVDETKWCPRCKEESLLERVRELARQRGGECLSTACRSLAERLTWRCAHGHRFQAVASAVEIGEWCRKCRLLKRGSREQMDELARERGGLCLSKRYANRMAKLRWRCAEGHVWDATPAMIIDGSWCPACRRQAQIGRKATRLTIGDMRAIAVERGGACLSRRYFGNQVHLRWRCFRGHTWSARPNQIRQGGWCPICSYSIPGTLEGMRALAERHAGRCLTRTWHNHKEPVRFECSRGHRFLLLGVVAKSGVWCPECRSHGRGRARLGDTAPEPDSAALA